MSDEHIHFVTGRLAGFSLRRVLAELEPSVDFDYSIGVLNITVAALMSPEWIAKRIQPPAEATRVLIPGYCGGDLTPIADAVSLSVERGPRDLRTLPQYMGHTSQAVSDYGAYDIAILAEINHVPRRSLEEILRQAASLRADGADIIDLGCEPGEPFANVGSVVAALKDAGCRVSIDSMNPAEIEPAVRAGAQLVLSVNKTNRDAAADWGCEVVAIPDTPGSLDGLNETVEFLDRHGVPFRIDPVLEPIGFGFAASLDRYTQVRQRYPDAEIMMGIGNLTELTDVDSAGVNVLLLGICQELGIRSVLTTQVINWARSSVRECDLARRLVHYSLKHRALPKHVEPRLVMLRDTALPEPDPENLAQLAGKIKDHNIRLFAEDGEIHLISAGLHLRGANPFVLLEELQLQSDREVDASHAFYLGYEIAKAVTALTLGKEYRQDEALDWGLLTAPEKSHRDRKNQSDNSE